ncbi:MAG: hypothetical protein BMS9Abin36_1590 [Gammaproteobacteria bacterium]|nr:MAG: hypothetical protein BMS9Abin36_1590 [Gammaproteobacteria bacterium]
MDLHHGINRVAITINWNNNDNVFIAEARELPGCIAHGDSYEQALENIQDAIQLWLDTAMEGVMVVQPVRRFRGCSSGNLGWRGKYSINANLPAQALRPVSF